MDLIPCPAPPHPHNDMILTIAPDPVKWEDQLQANVCKCIALRSCFLPYGLASSYVCSQMLVGKSGVLPTQHGKQAFKE